MAAKDVTTLMVLETLADDRFTGRTTVLAELQRRSGQPEKVIFRALERDDSKGFLDYGTWLWGAWLTDKGRAELARLQLQNNQD
jgi:hypothetical protein